MSESKFKKDLVKEIKERLPGIVIVEVDSSGNRSFPDRLLLYGTCWAALEVKVSPTASKRPNQEYYVELLDGMSHAWFINPKNKEEVLYELERTFKEPGKCSRLPLT